MNAPSRPQRRYRLRHHLVAEQMVKHRNERMVLKSVLKYASGADLRKGNRGDWPQKGARGAKRTGQWPKVSQRARFELVEVDEIRRFHAGFFTDLHELGGFEEGPGIRMRGPHG